MALLDSGCTKKVCKETRLDHYMRSLFDKYKVIKHFKSNSIFIFVVKKLKFHL